MRLLGLETGRPDLAIPFTLSHPWPFNPSRTSSAKSSHPTINLINQAYGLLRQEVRMKWDTGTPKKTICTTFMKSTPPLTREALIEIETLLNEAALRFDGYAYMEADPPRRTPSYYRDRWQRLISNPDRQASMEDLMTALFLYQRAGAREDGWFGFRDDEGLAALRLWLRLYESPTPGAWRFDEYATAWERRTAEEKSHAAEVVRRWLRNGEATWSVGYTERLAEAWNPPNASLDATEAPALTMPEKLARLIVMVMADHQAEFRSCGGTETLPRAQEDIEIAAEAWERWVGENPHLLSHDGSADKRRGKPQPLSQRHFPAGMQNHWRMVCQTRLLDHQL